MRVAQSLFILPYAALLAEFSSDYRERAEMMTFRLVLAVVSWVAVLWFAFKFIFEGEDSLSQASSYVPFALLIAGVILVFGLASTLGMLRAAKTLPKTVRSASSVVSILPRSRSTVSQSVICIDIF